MTRAATISVTEDFTRCLLLQITESWAHLWKRKKITVAEAQWDLRRQAGDGVGGKVWQVMWVMWVHDKDVEFGSELMGDHHRA